MDIGLTSNSRGAGSFLTCQGKDSLEESESHEPRSHDNVFVMGLDRGTDPRAGRCRLFTQSPPVTTAKVAPPAAPAPQAVPPKQTAPLTQTAPPKPGEPAAPATAAAPAGTAFSESDLAALLAPIALYPDTVIAQILMASTYPIEVIEAYRWLEKNKALKPEALAAEVEKQTWDGSVKSLVAAPEVLKMIDNNLAWMQKLGDAVLAQQKEVFAMVQTLRGKAMAEGTLKSDDHMKVSTQAAAPRRRPRRLPPRRPRPPPRSRRR